MTAQTKPDAKPTLAKLREPFPDRHISKLPKETRKQIDERKANNSFMVWKCPVCGGAHHKNAVHLDYVGHAALTDRLLDTDPEWVWEPLAFRDGLPAFDQTGGLWIKLTVLGVTRLGYGHAAAKAGQDPGAREKEVIGDALRNAAMRFGAALDLWHKGDLHGDDAADETVPANGESREDNPNADEPQGMPATEWAKLTSLLQATGVAPAKLLKEYGVKSLDLISKDQYFDAVQRLNEVLAKKAKAETDAKVAKQQAPADDFADLDNRDIPF